MPLLKLLFYTLYLIFATYRIRKFQEQSEIDYEGFIIYNPTTISFVPRTVGIQIVMHNISDPGSCRHRYPVYDQRLGWADTMDKLDRFIEKYSYCYNQQRKAYIYETRKNIPVPYSKKKYYQIKL